MSFPEVAEGGYNCENCHIVLKIVFLLLSEVDEICELGKNRKSMELAYLLIFSLKFPLLLIPRGRLWVNLVLTFCSNSFCAL